MRGKWSNKVVDFSNISVSSMMKVLDMIPAAPNYFNLSGGAAWNAESLA